MGWIPAARIPASNEAAPAIMARARMDPENTHGSRVDVP